ncbi:hypothetical protein FDUTEX481_03409 [Tolypothrix sp. PCC 7601]|nr:hypothetical protein FDUTEX481_03409 [Tolypothrix sp. PCC 7601]
MTVINFAWLLIGLIFDALTYIVLFSYFAAKLLKVPTRLVNEVCCRVVQRTLWVQYSPAEENPHAALLYCQPF